jgi:hypothetical protein
MTGGANQITAGFGLAAAICLACAGSATYGMQPDDLAAWARNHVPSSGAIEARYVNINGAGETWVTYDFATGAWSIVLPEYWARVAADGSYEVRDPTRPNVQREPAAPVGVACAVEDYVPIVAVRNLLGRSDLTIETASEPDGVLLVKIMTRSGSHCTTRRWLNSRRPSSTCGCHRTVGCSRGRSTPRAGQTP